MMEADALPVKVMAIQEASHDIDLGIVPQPIDKPQPQKKLQRKDIQGLRTVAISSVICFHVWPKVFTNGHLGVESFYVISGYLIAQMLSKHNHLNLTHISRFYSRLIHRIVPIYTLIVCATLHAGSLMLTNEDFKKMGLDAISALTFTTNFQNMFKDDDYFAQVFTYRFFLHTWLLAVEMQFYLLVPFIFYLLLKPCLRSKAAWISLLVITASFGLQLASNEAIAFGLVFCRFWQFFAGIMAFFLGAENRDQDHKEIDLFSIETMSETNGLLQINEVGTVSGGGCNADVPTTTNRQMLSNRLFPMLNFLPNALLTLLLLGLLMPWLFANIQVYLLEVFVVLLTACLLYLGSFQGHYCNIQMPYLLNNRASVEVGGASYIWYLIHWPAIQFSIYWSVEGALNLYDGVLIFFATMSAAVAIYRLVDARIRKISSFKTVLLVIAAFYGFCLVFVIPPAFHPARNEEAASFSGNNLVGEPTTTESAVTTTNAADEMSQFLNVTTGITLDLLENATKLNLTDLIARL